MRNSEWLYKPTPPSDEGGGFLQSKKTEGETENTINNRFLSLSHEFLVPAPSSEGANDISIQPSDKLPIYIRREATLYLLLLHYYFLLQKNRPKWVGF